MSVASGRGGHCEARRKTGGALVAEWIRSSDQRVPPEQSRTFVQFESADDMQIYIRVCGLDFDASEFQAHPSLPETGAIGATRPNNVFPRTYYWKSTPLCIEIYDDESVLNYISRYKIAIKEGRKFGSERTYLVVYARYTMQSIGSYWFSEKIIDFLHEYGVTIDIDQYFDGDDTSLPSP